jgi:glycosidase
MHVRLRALAACLLLVLLAAACRPARTLAPRPEAVPSPTSVPTTTPAPTATIIPPATALPAATSAAAVPWWNDAVFYEVFVRSFADSTTGPLANDGIGDLQGLIEKLDYLNDGDPSTTTDLGVTGIWLMPVAEAASYHGYDATDYRAIEADYGNNADFKRLIEEAHRRGIRVIVDLVLNHTSDEHPWFDQAADPASPNHRWYIWSDEQPDYLGPWGQPVWHRLGDRWYYGIFWSGMPDLNYDNPEVTAAMQDVATFWLDDLGADGFRLDAIRHLDEDGAIQENTPGTFEWLAGFYEHYKSVKPDAFAVGEVWDDTETAAQYVGGKVDAVFEFDLAQAIMDAVLTGDRSVLSAAMMTTLQSFPPGQYATFLTNHDQDRVMSELGGQADSAGLAATILLTLPGVPFIYYGEEIGMTGVKPDELIRTPMQWAAGPHAGFTTAQPWQPVNDDYEAVNVAALSADPDSLLSLYRRAIALRNAHPALRTGAFVPVEVENRKVYAFLRQTPDETLLALFNFDDEPLSDYALTLVGGSVNGATGAEDLLQGATAVAPVLDGAGRFDGYRPIAELAPRTGYVIRLAP